MTGKERPKEAKPPARKARKNRAGVGDLERRLAEAQEQQKATREILRVISGSPTDLTRVMAALVESAARLCEAQNAQIFRVEPGDQMRLVARYGPVRSTLEVSQARTVTRGSVSGRCIVDRATLHVTDLLDDVASEYPDIAPAIVRQGIRTTVGVPLMRDGVPIGAITAFRTEMRPFSESQVALLESFADQAVIAIENVRLFDETKEALDRQTVTSEILSIISTSPTDAQPVFDAIARHAVALCGGAGGIVVRYDGTVMRLAAYHNVSAESRERHETEYPRAPDRTVPLGAAIIDRTIVHVPNLQAATRFAGSPVQRSGRGSMIAVPLLLQGEAIGAIGITRDKPQGFSGRDIALLQTFADQAVIAIENVRLFKELEARNRDLTATGEILRVISTSPTDVQPVFDTMVASAVLLCEARFGAVFLLNGGLVHLAAHHNFDGAQVAVLREQYPMPPSRGYVTGRTILAGAPVQIPDAFADEEYRGAGGVGAAKTGFRSLLGVPMLRGGHAIGAIVIYRREPGEFVEKHINLLKTFADQAVIAIENVRLFTELRARTADLTRSVEQMTALAEVGQAVGSTLDLDTVLTTIVSRAVQLSGLDGGVVFEYDEATEEFVHRAAAETGGVLAQARRGVRYRKGEGALGRTAVTLEPVQVSDITVAGAYASRMRENLIESGVRAILAVPMIHQGRLTGCLGVTRNRPGDFPGETVELLRTFAAQSALAIQNARLFRELADKSRQLEAASQHKSEFLANMSHELRTPLNAIIGFSEVLSEKMFGELNEKQDEYLKDIHASGTHLLSLINDILDLSKVEAGRMELELTAFDLPTAIDSALMLVRERAGRRSIALQASMDGQLGQIEADERKVRQVVLNLLSNAIKFTPEGGRIEVSAVPKDGFVEVSVTDTGIGIALEDQEKVFEEFQQVGSASQKVEGTGLGLTLCRKFVELHGGRIWVKSQLGAGAAFTFTIPLQPGGGERG